MPRPRNNLIWTLLLTGTGASSLRMFFSPIWEFLHLQGTPPEVMVLLYWVLIFAPGAFFGAAIGQWFQRAGRGIFYGMVVWVPVVIFGHLQVLRSMRVNSDW